MLRNLITERECKIIIADSNRKEFIGADDYIRLVKIQSNAEMKRLAAKYWFFFSWGALVSIGIVGRVGCSLFVFAATFFVYYKSERNKNAQKALKPEDRQ